MKHLLLAAAAGLALSGCATREDRVDAHKNYPDVRTGNVDQTGKLDVRGWDAPGGPSEMGRPNTGSLPIYTVYDAQGNFVADSKSGTTDLAPGRYLVRLNAPGTDDANRTFWVNIESGKTTVVDAERIHEANRATAD